ncbi:hypothetical protein D3C75_1118550 [compost metagenome]
MTIILDVLKSVDFEFTVDRITLFIANFNPFTLKLFVKSKNNVILIVVLEHQHTVTKF